MVFGASPKRCWNMKDTSPNIGIFVLFGSMVTGEGFQGKVGKGWQTLPKVLVKVMRQPAGSTHHFAAAAALHQFTFIFLSSLS